MFLSPVLLLRKLLQLAPERTPGPARLPAVRPRAIALQALHKVAALKAVTLHQEWPLPNRPPPRLQPVATSSTNKLSSSRARHSKASNSLKHSGRHSRFSKPRSNSHSRSSGPSSLRSRHPLRRLLPSRHPQSRHPCSSLLLSLRTTTVSPQNKAQSNLHRKNDKNRRLSGLRSSRRHLSHKRLRPRQSNHRRNLSPSYSKTCSNPGLLQWKHLSQLRHRKQSSNRQLSKKLLSLSRPPLR